MDPITVQANNPPITDGAADAAGKSSLLFKPAIDISPVGIIAR
jgi:hypothetical protein